MSEAEHGVQTLKDEALIQELSRARGFRRVELAAMLGDSVGQTGPDRLRELLRETGPGTRDLHCASLLSLANKWAKLRQKAGRTASSST